MSQAQDWWRTAAVYQIYPRSFADANGDGIGDLAGIVSRLTYLRDLGVDAIWVSPFYPSPLADGGYDISDHRDVDPRIGNLEEFVQLTRRSHEAGIRVLIDIVPNHTSERHPWFQQALAAGPGSPERDRYIFRDGLGPGASDPPSDWRSHFGGSAWEPVGDGQWYCHLFAREQPDLDWDHPEVQQYFEDTLRFWADLGVDGFRVDVAHSLAKDLTDPLRSQPNLDQQLPEDGTDPLYDRDEVHEIYQRWRKVFDEYQPPKMAVAETWHPTNSRTYLYARPTELGQVFDFSLLKSEWSATQFSSVIQRSLDEHRAIQGGATWVLSSHDVPRHASRYGLPPGADLDAWLLGNGTSPVADNPRGLRRARAATLMMLALPGSAYLYQGEELGLPEVAELRAEQLQDPVWERTNHRLKGRDGCRVPIPWSTRGTSFGFGPNGAWLPQPAWFGDYAADVQDADPTSTLNLYRSALTLRRQHLISATDEVTWLDQTSEILHFARSNGWQCIVNFSDRDVVLPPGRVRLSSVPLNSGNDLPAEAAAWLQVSTAPED